MAGIDYQEPSFLGRLSFEWCGEGELRTPQYENQKSCFFLCLEFPFSEQNGEIQPEKVTRKIARKKVRIINYLYFLAERGGLKPQVSWKARFTRGIAAISFTTASFQTSRLKRREVP